MTNANSARDWLLAKMGGDPAAVARHFVAVSTNEAEVRQVRHRPRQHVRLLGLGRRPLLALVGDRPADRALCRHGPVPRAARRRLRHGRAFPHRPAGAEPAGGAGDAGRLVQQLPGRAEPRHPALRPEPRPLRRLLPAGRHGEQRQGRRPGGARGRLPDRPDHLGRARHQRPARLLPADPPGHQADPLRLPRRRPQPHAARRPPGQAARQLLRPDRGPGLRQDRGRGARGAGEPGPDGRGARAAPPLQGVHRQPAHHLDPLPGAHPPPPGLADRPLRAQDLRPGRGLEHQQLRPVGRGAGQAARRQDPARARGRRARSPATTAPPTA